MKYDWILFDADETLFHFDAFKGMQLMFSRKGVDFTQQITTNTKRSTNLYG